MFRNGDRIRQNTSSDINTCIDKQMERRIRFYSTQTREVINQRIEELDREWDIERILFVNASTLALTGLTLGLTRNKRFFAIPVVVLSFLWLHGVQGWCPPIPVLRRLGFRSRDEIGREKYALKALRGDFDALTQLGAEEADKMPRAESIIDAVQG